MLLLHLVNALNKNAKKSVKTEYFALILNKAILLCETQMSIEVYCNKHAEIQMRRLNTRIANALQSPMRCECLKTKFVMA